MERAGPVTRQIHDNTGHWYPTDMARQRPTPNGGLHGSWRILRTKPNLAARWDVAFRTVLPARQGCQRRRISQRDDHRQNVSDISPLASEITAQEWGDSETHLSSVHRVALGKTETQRGEGMAAQEWRRSGRAFTGTFQAGARGREIRRTTLPCWGR